MIKLSIIIPIYQVEGYLEKCLGSVICPGLDGYELILVDDGSTDASSSIARDYARRWPGLIRLMATENRGLGAARNVGLLAARGDFVQFLDSDDSLAPGAVQEMLELIDREDFDLCLFGFQTVDEEGRPASPICSCPVEGKAALKDYPRLLLCPPSGCNKLVRRELLRASGLLFPGRAWFEDLRTMPKLYLMTDKVISVHRPWYVYLQRQGSITKSYVSPRNMEIVEAVEDLVSYYRSRGAYEAYEQELGYIALYQLLLVAPMRFSVADPASPCLEELRQAYERNWPDYRQNKYFKEMPKKHKLLLWLISHREYALAGAVMNMKGALKGRGR